MPNHIHPADVFPFLNVFLLAWAALVFLPRWTGTRVLCYLTALGGSIVYVWLCAIQVERGDPTWDFQQLTTWDGVHELLSHKSVTLPAWLHYFCFDILVGLVIVRDSQSNGIWHLLVVPCVVLTFLAGPSGYLLYALLRTTKLVIFGAPSPAKDKSQ